MPDSEKEELQPDDPFQVLNSRLAPGSEQWNEEFAILATNVAEEVLKFQIPARQQSLFSPEDLAQETVIKLLGHLEQFHDYKVLSKHYVRVVAKRTNIDWVRAALAQKRSPTMGFVNVSPTSSYNLLQDISGDGQTPSQIAIGGELDESQKKFLIEVAELLDNKELELLQLKYFKAFTVSEIARLTSRTASAVNSPKSRILDKLRGHFRGRVEFQSFFAT